MINVRPHELFERRGQDLWLEIPITFNQAALGDEIVVPTLEEKVSYKVPAGTQPDTVFRLKGKGIKSVRSNKKGDLYVKGKPRSTYKTEFKTEEGHRSHGQGCDQRLLPQEEQVPGFYKGILLIISITRLLSRCNSGTENFL